MRVLALLLFLVSTHINADNIKIGYVNIDKVIEQSSLYQNANDQLVKEFEPRKIVLLEDYDYINTLKNKIKLPNDVNDDLIYHKQIKKIQVLNNNFQLESEAWQKELNKSQFSLLSEIEFIINNAINAFAKSQNYSLILYENIAFVDDEVNITQEIIMEIEKL